MYSYKIWDKKSSIKGVDAKTILQRPYLKHSDVFLVEKNGVISEINSVDTIRVNYNISSDATSEDVAQYYIDNIELTVDDKISILETELKKVKEQNERILEFARVLAESTNLDLINVLK